MLPFASQRSLSHVHGRCEGVRRTVGSSSTFGPEPNASTERGRRPASTKGRADVPRSGLPGVCLTSVFGGNPTRFGDHSTRILRLFAPKPAVLWPPTRMFTDRLYCSAALARGSILAKLYAEIWPRLIRVHMRPVLNCYPRKPKRLKPKLPATGGLSRPNPWAIGRRNRPWSRI
jgi:hypothetical protein